MKTRGITYPFLCLATLAFIVALTLTTKLRPTGATGASASFVTSGEEVSSLKEQGLYGSLGDAVGAARYRAQALPSGKAYQFTNPANRFRAVFDPAGDMPQAAGMRVLFGEESLEREFALRLTGYGYGKSFVGLSRGKLAAEQNRIEYEYTAQSAAGPKPEIKEWFVNSAAGIEHGVVLPEPPGVEGKGAAALRVQMEFSQGWRAALTEDGQSVTLSQAGGCRVLTYDQLHVCDARGRAVTARFELEGQRLAIIADDREAEYPLTIDPILAQPAAKTGGVNAADGNVVNSISNPSCGDFYQRQQFTSIDNSAGNLMGAAVAIDGETAVVGLPGDDIGVDINAGSVLVFKRATLNTWALQAQLVAPQPSCGNNEGDQFGFAVAVSGNRIVVGAPYNDQWLGVTTGSGGCNSSENSGSVYVFESDGTTWSLTNSRLGGDEYNLYGWSVGVSGDRIVVGVPGDDRNGADQGSIRILEKDPSGYDGWSDRWYAADEAQAGDMFGWAVAIRGETVVAGAPFDDLGAITNLGTAFIYKRSGLNNWYLHTQLIPLNGAAHDELGISVAVSPDEQTIVAGAYFDNETYSNQGSAYVYRFNGTNYIYQAKLTAADGATNDFFGKAVATNGREIVIGAYADDGSNGIDQGAVYVFKHNGTAWVQTHKLTAAGGAGNDYFGGAVAIDGGTVLVGAQGDDYPGLADIGSAYLFTCAPCPAVTINPATLPQGRVGALYDRMLTASGGTAPYTFSVSQGTLPPGLTLISNGTLSGVPTATGTYNFTVRATMSNGCFGKRDYSITVSGTCPAVTVSPTNPTLPAGTENLPYSLTFTASGGPAPHSFSVIAGTLPPGLSLATSGALSGKPSAAGTYNFTVRAVAANNCVGARACTLTIRPLLTDPGLQSATTEQSESGGLQYDPPRQPVRLLDTQQPAWSTTGSLGTARSLHTATLLANGKVLVVGGINVINPCCRNTGSADLYDSVTGQWSATGSPSTPRANHIAVRLQNGKVLIAGGNGDPFSNILASAEIYDPEKGTWSPAGNLNVARQSPRATLLADGRVLVSGGLVVSGGTASFANTAEVYDPATNAWSPTGPMNSARVLHTVTLLPNGKVLAVGGSAASFNPIQQRTAEIYDPATNAWTLTGELNLPRMTHTSTLLADGKVLLTGGGNASGDIFNNAELYDPASGQWAVTGGMTTPRVLHTLTMLPNGKVLAIGGSSANTGGLLRSSELYDPATGNWTATAELAAGRLNHTATLLPNGKVLAVAGSGAGQLTSAELYDAGTPAATSVPAASFVFSALAPESVVAAFGENLAASTQAAPGLPLPTTLAGVSVRVRDSIGVERLAPLFFVSPSQINYQIPEGTGLGQATVTVTSGDNIVAAGSAMIASVAPGLFSANTDGQGVAAAVALRVKADGTQSFEPVAQFDAGRGRFIATPIDLGPESDQVFLILYGTGIKFRSAPSAVSLLIGGVGSEVLFADAAPGFVGLDQVNVRLPRALVGRGEVDVVVSVDGSVANTVSVSIR